VLNVLRFAEQARLAEQVGQAGALFEELLKAELAGCNAVRDVRVFGLLIGIELDAARFPQRWFAKGLFWFYLAAVLKHGRYPVLIGFCQAERNVLKITPPLTVGAEEIGRVCATIGAVLRLPFPHLVGSALGGMLRSFVPWRIPNGRADQPTPAFVAR
jgi:4-aminobutyrate aminotransferase-like enzyme